MEQGAQDNRGAGQGAGVLKRVVICVDDFGYDDAVDQSIFQLAAQRRISATGALVDAPRWRADAPRLAVECRDTLDVGLHLNLSESFAEGPRQCEWSDLVLRAYTGRLQFGGVRAEIVRQLDAFETAFGRAPDFVDGHRHVHQLPVVRDALVTELAARYPQRKPWLRHTAPTREPAASAGNRFKAFVIGALGSRGLARLAARHGFAQNRHLLGVYGFSGSAEVHRQRLDAWLAAASMGDVLMCHTAVAGGGTPGDPISDARVVEHAVLSSPAFGELLARQQIAVSRLAACGIPGYAG